MKVLQGQEAVFYVESCVQRGDLVAQVDGPNSIAKSVVVVEPDNGGRYAVYYTPVEVGLYNISTTACWGLI